MTARNLTLFFARNRSAYESAQRKGKISKLSENPFIADEANEVDEVEVSEGYV
jgi:hypothetical protein